MWPDGRSGWPSGHIDRHQKIVAKPLAGYVARPVLSNAAVLGDGIVVLVVSPERLIAWALAAPPAAH